MKIANGKIGSVGDYELDIVDGNIVLDAKVDASPAHVKVGISVEALPFLKAQLQIVKSKIPGAVDDFLIDQAIAAIEAYLSK